MLNPFRQPELIKAEVLMSMPAKFRGRRRTEWSDPNRQAAEVDSFLEGPSFDRAGHRYFVDIPFGRIFRITPRGEWELVVEYDGWPNGLKLHQDGRFGPRLLTNVAFGGPDRRTIHVTDSLNGDILTARLPVAGKLLFGLQ